MTLHWIIGGGGLLGQAVHRELNESETFRAPTSFAWQDEKKLADELKAAVSLFSLRAIGLADWHILWAAGVGSFSSTTDAMERETRLLSMLLGEIRKAHNLRDAPGCISFASSAGAIYAGSQEFLNTELTPPSPNTAYAVAKLHQEKLLENLAIELPNVRVILARISTIYGSGQAVGKSQGLLSHIARNVIRRTPVHIYVPLDTVRDYISVNDVARSLLHVVSDTTGASGPIRKLIASETPVSIAEIVGCFRRIAKRAPKIITSASPLSSLYAKRMQFRSLVQAGSGLARTPLIVGIANLYACERQKYQSDTVTVGQGRPND